MREIATFLCDKSGIMAEPWAEAGIDCYCVDLQHPTRKPIIREYNGGGRIIFVYGDARYWTPPGGCRVIFGAAFPVCTDMAGSGAQDYSNLNGRIPRKGIPQLCDGLLLFNSCYHALSWSGAPFCCENPSGIIPTHFRSCDYTFHPWWYGDNYQKLTCLWTGNGFVMPEREYISKPEGTTQKIHQMWPSADRQNKRSETPAGFARAVFEANYKKEKGLANAH